ncbi:MAG: hypothetical protein ACRDOE_00110 [Streptosporangiaceae bacterium]
MRKRLLAVLAVVALCAGCTVITRQGVTFTTTLLGADLVLNHTESTQLYTVGALCNFSNWACWTGITTAGDKYRGLDSAMVTNALRSGANWYQYAEIPGVDSNTVGTGTGTGCYAMQGHGLPFALHFVSWTLYPNPVNGCSAS